MANEILDYTRIFMIQAPMRTGSHMLGWGLAQHPNVDYFNELLKKHTTLPIPKDMKDKTKILLLAQANTQKKSWGFTAQEEIIQFYENHQDVWQYTYGKIKTIRLRRRQMLQASVSFIQANKTGQWVKFADGQDDVTKMPQQPNTPISANDILRAYKFIQQTESYMTSLYFDNVITIYYEDMVNNWSQQIRRALGFLDLPYQELQPTTIKMGKSLRETLPNYEALKASLAETQVGKYFDE